MDKSAASIGQEYAEQYADLAEDNIPTRLLLPNTTEKQPSLRPLIWSSQSRLARAYKRWTLRSLPLLQFTNVPNDPWPGDVKRGQAILEGDLPQLPTLEELRHLHALGGNEARTKARQLVRLWVENQRIRDWQVTDTALRVVHLFRHYSFYGYGADPRLQDKICQSLHQQLFWLEQQFPTQNAEARFLILSTLLHAACGSKNFAPYLPEYLEVLEQTLPEYLDNYQHRSFSIAQQILMVRRLIALRTLLNRYHQTPDFILTAIQQGAMQLQRLQLGDGMLPQLRSTPHMPLKQLLLLVGHKTNGSKTTVNFPLGFATLRNQNSMVTVDVLEGTTALAFEGTVGKQRLITCCGMIDNIPQNQQLYQSWHDALSSTAAASTLDKDWNGTVEIEELTKNRFVAKATNQTNEQENIHRRVIEVTDKGYIKGYDFIKGTHNGVVRFHINPDITISMPKQPDAAILLNLPNGALWKAESSAPLKLEDSIYFDHNGEQHEAKQLVMTVIEGVEEYTWVFKVA